MIKFFLQFGFLAIGSLLTPSCSQEKNKLQKTIPVSKASTAKTIELKYSGEVVFRRTFASIQFMDDDKEIDRYLAKQLKSHPLLISDGKDSLSKEFERAGFVKNRELLLRKFKYDTATSFSFRDMSGKKINIKFDFTSEKIGGNKIIASVLQDSAEIKIDGIIQQLKYALSDVIPGGNKEIIILKEYYIMNGDNFEFIVLQVKT